MQARLQDGPRSLKDLLDQPRKLLSIFLDESIAGGKDANMFEITSLQSNCSHTHGVLID